MDIVESRSTERQPKTMTGPTVTLINTNETKGKDEEGNVFYSYTQYRLAAGERELIAVGSLPSGAEWDDTLRGIEREVKYDHADQMISKYSTDAADEKKRKAWVDYKAEVRATQKQKTYPQVVTYPEMPE